MTMPSPSTFLTRVIDPGLDWAATHAAVHTGRAAARLFLLASALQETGLQHRAQVVAGRPTAAGPARGWWQFEEPTVGLLLQHSVSAPRLRQLCGAAWVRPEPDDIWRAIEGHDLLAVGVARLLLLTDPQPVPTTEIEGWTCYAERLWRPGAWSRGSVQQRQQLRAKWSENWRAAQATLIAG
jgi:hypothetical protein